MLPHATENLSERPSLRVFKNLTRITLLGLNLKPDTKSRSRGASACQGARREVYPGLRSVRHPGPSSFFAARRPAASALSLASPSGVCMRERGRAVRKKQRPPPLPPFPGCRIRPWGREYAVFGGNSRPVSEPLLLSLASNTRVGSLTLRQLTPATYGVQLIWYETSTNLSQTTDIRLRPLFTDNGYPTFKAFSRGLLFFFHRSDWYYPASKSVIVSFK